MPFFEFSQNNSGGSFDVDDQRGIGPRVWVEAANVDEANNRAESIGLYWNGVEGGSDCKCCGDRWYQKWGDDQGVAAPAPDRNYDFNWHDTVYVHRADGTIERIKDADADDEAAQPAR